METVFRLIEDDGMGPVDDSRGYFLAPVRREAMHDDIILLCMRQEVFIDLISLEDSGAMFPFGLLPHTGPNISIDHIRLFHGFLRISAEVYPFPGFVSPPGKKLRIGFIAFRTGQGQLQGQT